MPYWTLDSQTTDRQNASQSHLVQCTKSKNQKIVHDEVVPGNKYKTTMSISAYYHRYPQFKLAQQAEKTHQEMMTFCTTSVWNA